MKYDIPGQHRWEDPPQRIGEPDWGILPSGVLRFIDTRVGSPKDHYVNLAEYQPQALRLGNQDPLRRRLALFTPPLPADRRRRTRLALLLASWCQRQRCLLCSPAGERRESAALPKRQGVGDRRPSKEVSVVAEPLPDEGVQ